MTPAEWDKLARETVLAVADELGEFTGDDCWDRLGPPPEGISPKRLGNTTSALKAAGKIVQTDRTVKSRRPERHGGSVQVWLHPGVAWTKVDGLPCSQGARALLQEYADAEQIDLLEAVNKMVKERFSRD